MNITSIKNNVEINSSFSVNKKKETVLEKTVFNNDILFVGLNPNASFEFKELKKNNLLANVSYLGNNSSNTINMNKKNVDISHGVQVTELCKNLNLDPIQSEKLRTVFDNIITSDKKLVINTKKELRDAIDNIGLPDGIKLGVYEQLSNIGSSFTSEITKEKYNLTFKDGIDKFVDSLGLSNEQSNNLKTLMLNENYKIRDELATIISTFAKAEKGEQIPARFIISAHSSGKDYWGEGNGLLSSDTVKNIAKIMPKASSQIEDFVIAACYAGSKSSLDEYKKVFPNLKTFMGYIDSAPGSYSGATTHLKTWEKVTRNDNQVITQNMFKDTRKGDHVSAWSDKSGYSVDPLVEKQMNARSGFIETITNLYPIFSKYYDEDKAIKDPHEGELRDVYNQIHIVLNNPNNDFEPEQRKFLETFKDNTLKTLYYSTIAEKFDSKYKNTIEIGYKLSDLEAPDFSKLSRAEARIKITELEKNYNEKKDNPLYKNKLNEIKKTIDLLSNGLILLDADKIPMEWI
ncbi:MAG: hypothetical protein AABZ74_05775 [Cyanobacteriota bacterium]